MDLYLSAFISSLNFTITVVGGESIFLSALTRRDRFALRFIVSVIVIAVIGMIIWTLGAFILMSVGFCAVLNVAVSFMLHLLHFSMTVVMMGRCFSRSFTMIFFACLSGYALQHIGSSIPGLYFDNMIITLVVSVAVCSVLYTLAYFIFAHRMSVMLGKESGMSLVPTLVLSGAMLFVALFLGILGFINRGESDIMYVLFSACQVSFCVALLAVQFLILYVMQEKRDAVIAERLHEAEKKQYEAIKNNIDAVNIKFHDIRHRLREVRGEDGKTYLGDIDALISEYDTQVRTGNEALDTILTEKNYICERGKIKFSCLADGALLGGMEAGDLYSLFGNALDNATEYLSGMPEEKRILKVFVRRYGENFVSISVKNYYEGGPLGGDPRTTKKDKAYHGFGIASMRLTAETYGGTLGLTAEGSTFCVNVLLPYPVTKRG